MMMMMIILLLLFESGLASFSSPEPLGLICNEHLVSRPRDQETTGSGDENGGNKSVFSYTNTKNPTTISSCNM